MKYATNLRKLVLKIAQKFGVDLNAPSAYLRLSLDAQHELVIQNIGNRISIARYSREEVGYWKPDAVLVCYCGSELPPTESKWIPVEITDERWIRTGECTADGVWFFDEPAQELLTRWAEEAFTKLLANEDWLNAGVQANIQK